MSRPTRTVFLIGVVIGLVTSLVRLVTGGRHEGPLAARASSSPQPVPPAAAVVPAPVAVPPTPPETASTTGETGWVPPIDGDCPEGYPVKAKATSKIFHVPGGASYARTRPDRCYADPASAIADGFRPAQR